MDSVASVGIVVSVRGAVVDVRFDGQLMPPINTALVVEWDRPDPLVLEVHSHVDPVTVRGNRAPGDRGSSPQHEGARDWRAHFGSGRRRGSGASPRRGRDIAGPRTGPAVRYPTTRYPQSTAGARG